MNRRSLLIIVIVDVVVLGDVFGLYFLLGPTKVPVFVLPVTGLAVAGLNAFWIFKLRRAGVARRPVRVGGSRALRIVGMVYIGGATYGLIEVIRGGLPWQALAGVGFSSFVAWYCFRRGAPRSS